MPNYISAYDLQQRDGLTRQRIIDLAEVGPSFWRASDVELFDPDVEQGYFGNGYQHLKIQALEIWNTFLAQIQSAKSILAKVAKESTEEDYVKAWAEASDEGGEVQIQNDEPNIYHKISHDDREEFDTAAWAKDVLRKVDFQVKYDTHPNSMKGEWIQDLEKHFEAILHSILGHTIPYENIKDMGYSKMESLSDGMPRKRNPGDGLWHELKTEDELWHYIQYSSLPFFDVFSSIFYLKSFFLIATTCPGKPKLVSTCRPSTKQNYPISIAQRISHHPLTVSRHRSKFGEPSRKTPKQPRISRFGLRLDILQKKSLKN